MLEVGGEEKRKQDLSSFVIILIYCIDAVVIVIELIYRLSGEGFDEDLHCLCFIFYFKKKKKIF